MINRDNSFI